jgi:rRNA maturation RNase YbeY
MAVAIKNLTRRRLASRSVFSAIATSVLPSWDISLVFVGPTRARALNKKLRRKNYIPNVLSYTLGEESGEVILCLSEATKQAPAYNLSPANYTLYLFIHGLLHIKGWAHGATMEACERKLLAKFVRSSASSLSNETTHRNRNRHRHVPSKDGRRRGAR